MSRFRLLLGILLLLSNMCAFIQAHEGHQSNSLFSLEMHSSVDQSFSSFQFAHWIEKIGKLHLLFLHFPIALIVMTVLAEWLWIWFANPLFSHAARFMILAAAIFSIPTALLGQIFGYGSNYEGLSLDLYVWHRYFGFLTTGLAIITAILRELYLRKYAYSLTSYYTCLVFLFLSVSLTGAFGGSLTFGLDIW